MACPQRVRLRTPSHASPHTHPFTHLPSHHSDPLYPSEGLPVLRGDSLFKVILVTRVIDRCLSSLCRRGFPVATSASSAKDLFRFEAVAFGKRTVSDMIMHGALAWGISDMGTAIHPATSDEQARASQAVALYRWWRRSAPRDSLRWLSRNAEKRCSSIPLTMLFSTPLLVF